MNSCGYWTLNKYYYYYYLSNPKEEDYRDTDVKKTNSNQNKSSNFHSFVKFSTSYTLCLCHGN